MMKPILVVGSLNMDMVVHAHATPSTAKPCRASGLPLSQWGGNGANQAVAAGRLGGQVTMVGRVRVCAGSGNAAEGSPPMGYRRGSSGSHQTRRAEFTALAL